MEDNNVDAIQPAEAHELFEEDLPLKRSALTTEEPVVEGDAPDSHNQSVSFHERCAESHQQKTAATTDDGSELLQDAASEDEGVSEDSESDNESDDPDEMEAQDLLDDHDARTVSINGSIDSEVERHEIEASLPGTDMSVAGMAEASKTALFRRYSKMTPSAMEEQERSFHEDAFQQDHAPLNHLTFCPEPSAQSCQNPACADQLRWRDARIAELQAALDHMTEAMAIQQRDMASQRVFLSRQAEQLTNLSNKLHRDKVALHVERERFQKTVASTPPIMTLASKLKPAAGKIKSPVKKLFSAASNRRASFASGDATQPVAIKFQSSITSPLDAESRVNSSSQLRHNPLVTDTPATTMPLKDRSSSLSVLDLRPSFEQSVIAITPTKDDAVRMVDVKLNDGFSPTKYSNPTPQTPTSSTAVPDLQIFTRTNRVDSSTELSAEQKKQSLGDRLRSIRWGRS